MDVTTYKAAYTAHNWSTRREGKQRRMALVSPWMNGKFLPQKKIVEALETLLVPGDRVVIESVQKQADFLSRSLAKVNPKKVHDLKAVIWAIARPDHMEIFEQGIASEVDFSFAGPQSLRLAQMLEDGQIKVNSINTYVELSARLFVDLIPNAVLVCADMADHEGNIYTGANTEDTPSMVEAAAFRDGIVIVQVNQIVDKLPRIDIPGGWIDVIVESDRPFAKEPIQTRDPKDIKELQILTAMMVIRGVYERHQVLSLNHGVGFDTASIELLLPTYGGKLGLKGKICRNWILNPQPTLIPAIESGWVESVHSFGNEDGMEKYVAARPDIYFTGQDGSLRSNRVFAQLAGHYAVDLFAGSTLQIDSEGNSSTVTKGRIAGFGGAPNLGSDARGRRHPSPAWLSLITSDDATVRGRKLCVQVVETFKAGGVPLFVETLDAVQVGKDAKLPIAPVMLYGNDVSHVATEEGIAYLYKADGLEERRAAVAAVAGVTKVGLKSNAKQVKRLREKGVVAYPEDLGVRRSDANRSLLAARSMKDLVTWSGGLYEPPARFRSW
ncbi:malonate decarboxylase subunit alpha [Bradyrhizobium sp. Arg237L]|uniref:malonate decarboxylase subunit alpha n=1 Tax=Bradyrhizobium sp. Arg237L TaxID=3003352 RepID=UPI00249E1569|nr:malonate decarboxylase subunit alpha [Bradyrhizobium sp. Arg237L]MDI4232551.1 malonate decarboxylase subunit alpha [Bradyrhizobium sp. Arg237L]